MFESKAELFQQHWQHFRLWRQVSPRKRPVAASILAIKQPFVYCCASFGRGSMVYVGIHVKRIVSDLRETLEIHAELYPVTWAAFHGLEKAIAEEFPGDRPKRKQGKVRRCVMSKAEQIKRLQHQVAYIRRRRKAAQTKLQDAAQGKEDGQAQWMRVPWLVRVCLAQPLTSCRALAQAHSDFIGSSGGRKGVGCSRFTITRIKDAFVEVCKEENAKAIRRAVSRKKAEADASGQRALQQAAAVAQAAVLWNTAGAAVAAARQEVALVGSFTLLHIHDEAKLRLRTFGDNDTKPTRSRSSMVQQHAVYLHSGEGICLDILTELDGLADKRAETIATSVDRVLRSVAQIVGDVVQETGTRKWFLVHVLVGDGIYTNNKAGRIVLAESWRLRVHEALCYLLILVVCGNRQANLSLASAVQGKIANTAFRMALTIEQGNAGENFKGAHTQVCGVAVRLSKYLINDYYSEFLGNVRDWASQLRIVPQAEARPEEAGKVERLCQLYGERVLPRAVLSVLNNGCGVLEHALTADTSAECDRDPDEYKRGLVATLVEVVRERILVVSEHPTYTRFFTFREHIEALALLDFLGCHAEILKLVSVSARVKNTMRLRRVNQFFRRADARNYLRRTVLCLRLTGAIHDMAAATLEKGKPPMLVRFARGEGRRAVNSGVAEVLGSLHLDPDLDKVSAITAVLGTGVDLLLRLRRYELYPFKMSLMCSAWNEHYGMACLEFLSAKEEELDVGCGLPLQREALDQGTEAEALRWLQSPSCQDMLTQMWRGSCATNLPVERKHVETKRNEKSRLCHLATAGRDQIQRHVLRQRTEALRTLEQAVRAQRRVNKLQISALAWERMPHLVMIPDNEIGKRPAAKAAAGRRQSGCQETLQTYIRDNKKDLMSSLAEMRLEAAAAVKRATPDCLTTTGDWLEYMEQHKDEFRERMRTATKERRQRSKRLRARADLAAAAKRILPKTHGLRSSAGSMDGSVVGSARVACSGVEWQQGSHRHVCSCLRARDICLGRERVAGQQRD